MCAQVPHMCVQLPVFAHAMKYCVGVFKRRRFVFTCHMCFCAAAVVVQLCGGSSGGNHGIAAAQQGFLLFKQSALGRSAGCSGAMQVIPSEQAAIGAFNKSMAASRDVRVRPIRSEDLSTGLIVWYRSQSRSWLQMKVENPQPYDEGGEIYIRLNGKHHALFTQVFVEEEEQSIPMEQDEPSAQEWVKNKFLPWLAQLIDAAKLSDVSIAQLLHDRFWMHYKHDVDAAIGALKGVVPWAPSGYVNFQSQPKTSKSGTVHVSFFCFRENAYPGNALFLKDALVLLDGDELDMLLERTIQIRPVGNGGWKFGWEADGPVVNGCLTFICSSLAFFALLHNETLPESVSSKLGNIKVSHKKHENAQARLLSSFVSSAAARFANRSVTDPIYMSAEFERSNIPPGSVKAFVKLYRNRTLSNPKLQMGQKVEDATIRLMTTTKICKKARGILADIVADHEMGEHGPFNISMIMSKYICIGAGLTESCHDTWSTYAQQTAAGQELALKVYRSISNEKPQRMDESNWDHLLLACGFWTMVKEQCCPLLMMNQTTIASLDEAFNKDKDIRAEYAELANKEPANSVSAIGDIASWMPGVLPSLKQAQNTNAEEAKKSGENVAAFILGKQEAKEISASNYFSALCLDVHNYSEALKKLTEENTLAEGSWAKAQDRHVKDVQRFQKAMQEGDVVFWNPEDIGIEVSKGVDIHMYL